MKCPHCQGTGEIENPDIGSLVLAARKTAGITQLELSEKCGLSRGQIANLETGRTDLSIKSLQRVAVALNVRPSELLP